MFDKCLHHHSCGWLQWIVVVKCFNWFAQLKSFRINQWHKCDTVNSLFVDAKNRSINDSVVVMCVKPNLVRFDWKRRQQMLQVVICFCWHADLLVLVCVPAHTCRNAQFVWRMVLMWVSTAHMQKCVIDVSSGCNAHFSEHSVFLRKFF